MKSASWRAMFCGTIFLAASGCSGIHSSGAGRLIAPDALRESPQRSQSAAACTNETLGMVVNGSPNAVLLYQVAGSTLTACGSITGSLSGPDGLAVDTKGRIYVGNDYALTVSVFDSGGSPVETLAGLNGQPHSVAVDAKANVWAGNLPAPSWSFFRGGHTRPTGYTIDPNLYVGEYVALGPKGLLVDEGYFQSQNGAGIDVSRDGGKTWTVAVTGLQQPCGIAVARSGALWLCDKINFWNFAFEEFKPPYTGKPAKSFLYGVDKHKDGGAGVGSIALDPSGSFLWAAFSAQDIQTGNFFATALGFDVRTGKLTVSSPAVQKATAYGIAVWNS